MKVLVTGGAGFIGSNLVRALLDRGEEVIVLDNLSSGYKKNLPFMSNIRFIKGDIRNATLLNRLLPNIEIIYHLAASVGNHRSLENPILDAQINTIGTLQLLEAAHKHNINKVIVSSSAGIFGEIKQTPINEDHPIAPKTPYAVSKLYCEKISLAYADLYPLNVICLRYFNVYGPNQHFNSYTNVISTFVAQILQNKQLQVYGDGEQTRDFVAVDDIVQANIKCAEATLKSAVFNIGSGSQVSINQLIVEISQIFGKNFTVEYKAKRICDVQDSLADISAAKQFLGYQPQVSLRQELEKYIAWYQSAMCC